MKALLLIFLLTSLQAFSQNLTYTPGQSLNRTISLTYYSTDYIYFENSSGSVLNLKFELIEESPQAGWHTSLCTHTFCANTVPSEGELGSVNPGAQGYLALSLSTNETFGEATYRFVISDKTFPGLSDTITFNYKVEDNSQVIDQPWAKITYTEDVVLVLIKNPQYATAMSIYAINGDLLVYLPVEAISSYRLDNFANGTYIIAVKDETGRKLTKKIVKIG